MEDIKFNGNKLLRIRKGKDITQEKLAELVGVSRQTIYFWESNQNLPDVEKVGKLCEVLEVELSDLMDGMTKTTSAKGSNNETNLHKKRMNKKIIIRIIMIFLLVLFIVYIITSMIKFFRLKDIANKWEELDKKSNYYFNYVKIYTDKDNKRLEEAQAYDVYLKDNIMTTIYKNVETQNVSYIMIDNFNTNESIVIEEDSKTYKRGNVDIDTTKLSSYLPNTLKLDGYSNSSILAISFEPKFSVKKSKDNYIIDYDSLTTIINKDTGLIFYEEDNEKNAKVNSCVKYFTIELDTDKEFEIDLNDYVEIK